MEQFVLTKSDFETVLSLENKKSAVDLAELAIAVVVLGIVVSVGATILINVRDTNNSGTAAYNVSDSAAIGLNEYGNWFKIIVIVGISAGILALIFMAFGRQPEEQTGNSY